MSSIARKERRIQWWKQHGKQVDQSTSGSDVDSTRKPKKFKKTHHDRRIKQKEMTNKPIDKKTTEENLGENEKKNRLIIFVGNLPFNLTKEDIIQHFRCTGKVVDFRLMTKKDNGGSKGCGFLELDNFTSYEKALNLHHSTLGGRRINVEVTCGGGGSGKKRTDKLNEKKKKFKKKRLKKHNKPDSNTNDNNKTEVKAEIIIKKEELSAEVKTENKDKQKSKKRKLELTEEEAHTKKKPLNKSGAITAMVQELQLEGLVEDKKAENIDLKCSIASDKEGKKKKKKRKKNLKLKEEKK